MNFRKSSAFFLHRYSTLFEKGQFFFDIFGRTYKLTQNRYPLLNEMFYEMHQVIMEG